MKRILLSLFAVLLMLTIASAESVAPIVTVNGEDLPYSEYNAIESAYLYQYETAGMDLTNPETYAYLQDLALTYAIEQLLVRQDMQAQGCYDFTAEEETWFQESGKAAYEQALSDVQASIIAGDPTLSADEVYIYALAYAESLGVTAETYVDFYRTQYASAKYYDWLIREQPVTDEDVQALYAARVEESKTLYAADAAAFETAMSNGNEVWYRPEGYRSILQILLPAQGQTDDEKLADVQTVLDEIYTRLENGETFEALIREYGADASFNNEAFFNTGYQVHQDSVIWEDAFVAAAFSAEMTQPGCWSQPFASDLGVHVLYYLADVPGGPIELAVELADALRYVIYTERYTAAQAERINALADDATIVFH